MGRITTGDTQKIGPSKITDFHYTETEHRNGYTSKNLAGGKFAQQIYSIWGNSGQQMASEHDLHNIGKQGSQNYTEVYKDKVKKYRRKHAKKGVRISGRRFTTGSYKRRGIIEQVGYDSNPTVDEYTGKRDNPKMLETFKNEPISVQSTTDKKYSSNEISIK